MKIYAVGLGPGSLKFLAPKAREAILASDVIAGYAGYLKLIPDLVKGKEIIATGMKNEIDRCETAIAEVLKGKQVCIVSGGDAGIYGMAALLYELA
jgi:precorrin-3B C17-methyltransferase